MGFFDLFRRENRDAREDNGRSFTDEERERSKQTRMLNAIRRQRLDMQRMRLEDLKAKQEQLLMEQQIASLENDIFGEDEDEDDEEGLSPDNLFGQLLQQVLASKMQPPHPASPEPGAPPAHVTISIPDEQLRAMKEKIPAAMLKKLKGMNDEQVVTAISMNYPDLVAQCDDDTVRRAVAVIRE